MPCSSKQSESEFIVVVCILTTQEAKRIAPPVETVSIQPAPPIHDENSWGIELVPDSPPSSMDEVKEKKESTLTAGLAFEYDAAAPIDVQRL